MITRELSGTLDFGKGFVPVSSFPSFCEVAKNSLKQTRLESNLWVHTRRL
jgi:hypothetical protein